VIIQKYNLDDVIVYTAHELGLKRSDVRKIIITAFTRVIPAILKNKDVELHIDGLGKFKASNGAFISSRYTCKNTNK